LRGGKRPSTKQSEKLRIDICVQWSPLLTCPCLQITGGVLPRSIPPSNFAETRRALCAVRGRALTKAAGL
jgi:hypothetical protein